MATISVSLPTDGTTADVADYNTPINTIVNAINGGLDNANIASGAAIATSKLASDNGITAAMLSTSAITLGYAQIITNFTTTNTSATQVTSLSTTVTIPAGSRRIKITVFTNFLSNTASANTVTISIWDGTVGSGTQLAQGDFNGGAAGDGVPTAVFAVPPAPAVGSKTYNVGLHVTTSGTAQLSAAFTTPAFILVEAI